MDCALDYTANFIYRELKVRVSKMCLLTPNTTLIQLWCARSKWNMDLKLVFLVEIVMNELRKLKMSADFFANTSHDICRCPGV